MVRVPAARILVIDDDPKVVDLLMLRLREEGYGILRALTGDAGVKLAIASRPDLVVLDLTLPGMLGIDVLKHLRTINPTIKVIVVSGNIDPALAREALELGALAYVDKPFDIGYLKRVIAMALASM